MNPEAPPLTVAIIHRLMRGYPERCLRSLVGQTPEGTEFLLLTDDLDCVRPCGELTPGLRVLPIHSGDRASAKNRAVDAARGEYLLIVSADFVAAPGAVGALLEFLRARPAPALASAQVLYENGMRRRTSYHFPSLLRQFDPLPWLRAHLLRKRPPRTGPAWRADALRAFFLAGPAQTFREVGEFHARYRFGFEDVAWSWRAAQLGVERWAVPEAHAYNLAPQLHGEVPPAARLEIERSLLRTVSETRGPSYAALFRTVCRAKALLLWSAAALLNRVLCRRSTLLAHAEEVHRALWRMASPEPLPPDAESRSRWESAV